MSNGGKVTGRQIRLPRRLWDLVKARALQEQRDQDAVIEAVLSKSFGVANRSTRESNSRQPERATA